MPTNKIMRWLHRFEKPPKMSFITLDEPVALDVLHQRIEERLGWACIVPEQLQRVELKGSGIGHPSYGIILPNEPQEGIFTIYHLIISI